jgi:hypothetical protein
MSGALFQSHNPRPLPRMSGRPTRRRAWLPAERRRKDCGRGTISTLIPSRAFTGRRREKRERGE